MSGWHAGIVSVPRCPHDAPRWERCGMCDYEREANRIAYARSVQDPARVILDAIAARRRWFDACAFCAPNEDALLAELRHTPGCPWAARVSSVTEEKKT